MQMDFRIPFMVQGPDIVGSLDAGAMAAARQNEIGRMNDLAALYQAQGADIFAGNPAALNALAQFDPMAAYGIADQRQAMDARALQMDATRFDMERARQQDAFARQMMEQEAQAAAAADEQAQMDQLLLGAAPLYASGNKPAIQQYWESRGMRPLGIPEYQGVLAQRGLLDTFSDVRELNVGPQVDPQSAMGKLAQDFRNGLITQEQYEFEMQRLAPTGMSIQSDGRGGFTINQGPGVVGNMPEGQSQNAIFATRARAALEDLEAGNPDSLTSYGQRFLSDVPFNIGRQFQSNEFQEAENAGTRFLQAILRKDTGAAITADEQREYGGVYLPQPGDTPEMAETRRQARNQALIALESGMSPDAILAQSLALTGLGIDSQSGEPIAGGDRPQAIDFSNVPPDELLRMDVLKMSAEEIAAWNAAVDALGGQ